MFSEYKICLKNPFAEEIIDLVFFRPLGYVFVKIAFPFPITPNQISLCALLIGTGAGFVFSFGTASAFCIGAMVYGLSNILDCSDGMLARLKKNGSPVGRIVDGVIDYITGVSVFVGLGIGLSKALSMHTVALPCNAWILVIAAATSTIFHAVFSDYFRNSFLDRQKDPLRTIDNEHEEFKKELVHLKKNRGNYITMLLITLYLGYMKLQSANKSKAKIKIRHKVRVRTVIAWNLIGPSTHIAMMIIAMILLKPAIFFFYTIVFANCWMLALLLWGIFSKKPSVAVSN